MSGIVGIYHLDVQPVDPLDIGRMVETLAHRGPDGADVWCRGSVGLGHRMLWTTPESLEEKLPLANRTGDLVITADARIDNRDELIGALDMTDHPPMEIADSQLILAAYEKWGERCPEHLLGDFAFVIWDGHRQVLFCARDHFGMKPFYYCYQSGQAFAFASEVKALLGLPWVPRRLNEVRVADYLASLVEDKAITFFQGIVRLPPAQSMTLNRERLRFQEYWSLDPSREVRCSSDEEYAETFREIFAKAVRCRLRSNFPVGVALSGGLDSSFVVGVARELAAESGHPPLHTFSCVFDDVPECDERSFIRAVLAQGGVQPHFVHPDRLSALADIEQVLWHQDQPFCIRNLFLWMAMYGAAQAQGVRVMLDGEDGDTVVSYGEEYLIELARTGQWAAFAREANALSRHWQIFGNSPMFWLQAYGFSYLNELARAGRWIAFAGAASGISRHFEVSRRQLFWSQGLRPITPEPMRRIWRMLRRREQAMQSNGSLINQTLLRRVGFAERATALMARYTQLCTPKEEHLLSLTAGITSCILEENDKASAAFDIETRHPFWDRRLVEFCLALPPEQKLREGWTRWILRQAMTDILPDEVQWRVGKSNLSANFARSLFLFERERLEQVLVRDPTLIEEYVDISVLHEVYQRGDANTIWPAVILALWLRQTGLTSKAYEREQRLEDARTMSGSGDPD